MEHRTKITVIWLMLVLCMMLHFDYHVSGIFSGVDVQRPDARGVYPPTLILIRALFQVFPMGFALLTLFFAGRAVRIINLVLAVIYAPLHGFHVAGILRETPVDPTQVQLLVFTFLLSLLLAGVSWKWLKAYQTATI